VDVLRDLNFLPKFRGMLYPQFMSWYVLRQWALSRVACETFLFLATKEFPIVGVECAALEDLFVWLFSSYNHQSVLRLFPSFYRVGVLDRKRIPVFPVNFLAALLSLFLLVTLYSCNTLGTSLLCA